MNFLKRTLAKAKTLYGELRKKGKRYWLTVLVLLILGTIASEQLGERGVWINLPLSAVRTTSARSPFTEQSEVDGPGSTRR